MGGIAAAPATPESLQIAVRPRCAVVGAGAAGLSAARVLRAAGCEVTVFDKGRKAGGRIALRDTAQGAFDHGAPCLGRDAPVSAIAGQVAFWPDPLAGSLTGVPTMQQLAQQCASDLPLRLAQHVERIAPNAASWQLWVRDAVAPLAFDAVVVTVPQPQLQALLPETALLPATARIEYDPCWMLLWAPTAATLPAIAYAVAIDHAVLQTLIREDLKPGRSGLPRYVIHARADWSCQWLEAPADVVAAQLQSAAADWLGLAPGAHHLAAHRWRYAQVRQALGTAQCTLAPGLHYAGDGCLGNGIAGAIHSGQAAAHALLSTF